MEQTGLAAAEKILGTSFALPARVAEPYHAQLAEHGIVFEQRIVRVDPYLLDAYVFRGCDRAHARRILSNILAIIGETPFSDAVTTRWGTHKVPYFCGKGGSVKVMPKPSDEKAESRKEREKIETEPYHNVCQVLERLSKLAGGLDIVFHEEDRFEGFPPLPDRDNLLHIYPWNHPPGDSDEHYVRRAFDLLIDKDCAAIFAFKGVPGRGELVGDGENSLVQLVGNNWYLLFCIIDYHNRHTTACILEQALAVSLRRYQALGRGKRPADAVARLDRKRFIEAATDWVNKTPTLVDKLAKEQAEQIERLRRELANRERILADHRRALEVFKNDEHAKRIIASLPQQWRRIRANPRVATLSLVGDGIHVTTTPIVIAHEGRRYPLGRFVIRINGYGILSIWNADRLHPEGVPHPHISKTGTPCFGNATTAITDAVVQHRYADAVDYVLRWLADGYEDNLALNKIAEWPFEFEAEDTACGR